MPVSVLFVGGPRDGVRLEFNGESELPMQFQIPVPTGETYFDSSGLPQPLFQTRFYRLTPILGTKRSQWIFLYESLNYDDLIQILTQRYPQPLPEFMR